MIRRCCSLFNISSGNISTAFSRLISLSLTFGPGTKRIEFLGLHAAQVAGSPDALDEARQCHRFGVANILEEGLPVRKRHILAFLQGNNLDEFSVFKLLVFSSLRSRLGGLWRRHPPPL
jgi:hypothetical protein